jgi:hypothetical protein
MAPRKNVKSQSQLAEEAREKANKAEARSAKAPRADTAKAPKNSKEKPAPRANNDDLDRALFLDYLPKLAVAVKGVKDAKDTLAILYKQANQDGFSKKDFDEVAKLQGAEGEKIKKAAIARSLRIARWLGMALGAQLDMFEEPDRVPAADRAFEEGKTQAMQGVSLKCDYAQETEQYRRFAEGWHAGQAILSKGFKKLHPEVAKDEAEKVAKKAQRDAEQAEDAKAFDAPASGVAMTRKDFEAQKAANKTPA